MQRLGSIRPQQKNSSRCERLSLDKPAGLKAGPWAGVDGCAGGWLLAVMDGPVRLFPGFRELLDATPSTRLIVDIPMGLPNLRERDLESTARKLLAGRSSSLFPVPCRDAVYAGNYAEASAINFSRLGKKLSKQTWNICRKIREVDELLRQDRSRQALIVESHPELAFHLISETGMVHSKKTTAGLAERLALLENHLPGARWRYEEALDTYPRKSVSRDDIVDAMVLLVLGGISHTVLGDSGIEDELGLPIRMLVPGAGPYG